MGRIISLTNIESFFNHQPITCLPHGDHTYIAAEQLQHKRGDAAIDSYQYVDAGQNHVGRAGDLKEEWGWVHQRGDRPPERKHTDHC